MMPVGPVEVATLDAGGDALRSNRAEGAGFGAWFEHELRASSNLMLQADQELQNLVVGDTDNLHHVMLTLEKARTSFEIMLQVRNRLLDGVQEVLRMQV